MPASQARRQYPKERAGAGSASGLDMFHQAQIFMGPRQKLFAYKDGLDRFHKSVRGKHALETRGGKGQLEAIGGCLLKAITNLLATEFVGWNGGIATHLRQAYYHELQD